MEGDTEEESSLGQGMSKITSKGFPNVESAREALIQEAIGHNQTWEDGHPAMEIANGYDPRYRNLKEITRW